MSDALAALRQAAPELVVVTDPSDLAPHLLDWRRAKKGTAAALLRPSTVGQVQAIVRTAAEHRVPLVPQGGNTGMVGGSVPEQDGTAWIVSLARMNRIIDVDAAGLSLTCEAGAILQTVHETAAAAGCAFPLSLGAKGSATIGGLIATNAGGTQVLRHGTMRALVVGLQAVLPDGSLLDQLSPLRKDNSGYDIKQLLIGAEGTLGLVTAAVLRLVPAPAARAVCWAGVPSLQAALALLTRLRASVGETVESFEVMPADGMALLEQHIPAARSPLSGEHAWHCLIETAGASVDQPSVLLEQVLASALGAGEIADATIARSETAAAALWRLREEMPEAERRDGAAIKNDIAVPVARVPEFHARASDAMQALLPGVRVFAFGHLGDGNLHFNLRAPAGVEAATWVAANAGRARVHLHDLVRAFGGSISAEHGIGTLKAAELARLGDPGKLKAMRAIKVALDPLGIMNPGKLFI